MPYFVYKITPPLQLTHLDTKEEYKHARKLVRGLRQDQSEGAELEYRMIFAKKSGRSCKATIYAARQSRHRRGLKLSGP